MFIAARSMQGFGFFRIEQPRTVLTMLRSALDPVAAEIQAAFVYGSIAKGTDTSLSDIDVLVISDTLSYGELFGTLEQASEQLGRKVAPTIYSSKELRERVRKENAFVKRILSQPRVWLFGDEHVLGADLRCGRRPHGLPCADDEAFRIDGGARCEVVGSGTPGAPPDSPRRGMTATPLRRWPPMALGRVPGSSLIAATSRSGSRWCGPPTSPARHRRRGVPASRSGPGPASGASAGQPASTR